MTTDELYAQLSDTTHRLAAARQRRAEAKEAWKELLEGFKAHHQDLLDEEAKLKDHVDDLDAEVRRLALSIYDETGDKKPCPGVGVRVLRKVEYIEDAALKWAKENSPVFIVPESLDTKAFERFARDNIDKVPVAELREEPQATVSRDLSGPEEE